MIRKISFHIIFLIISCTAVHSLHFQAKFGYSHCYTKPKWMLCACGFVFSSSVYATDECVFVLAVNRTILLTQVRQCDCRSFSHSLFLAVLPAVQRSCGEIWFETSLWVRNYFYSMLKVMGWNRMNAKPTTKMAEMKCTIPKSS